MNRREGWFSGEENRHEDRRYTSAGQDILDEVTRAVNEGNYQGLAKSLSGRINGALNGAVGGFMGYRGGPAQHLSPFGDSAAPRQQDAAAFQTVSQLPSYFLNDENLNREPGRRRRNLGIAGEVFFGFFAFMFGISMIYAFSDFFSATTISLLVLKVANVYGVYRCRKAAKNGEWQLSLIDEYYRYGQAVGDREYFSIRDLSQMVLEPFEETRQNLIDMKKGSMLPQASFDAQYTTVLLTDHARMLYQNAMDFDQDRTGDTQTKAAETSVEDSGRRPDGVSGQKESLSPDVQKILQDGEIYIRKVRAANDEIPDTEEMSDKLYRLENVTASIFSAVRRNPDKAKDLRRMMGYYLPTTEKLLDAYLDCWRSPAKTKQSRDTMQEIEQAIDAVCDGFERVLAKMTETDAMDISSDIRVMKHMMEQDGMTSPDLKV